MNGLDEVRIARESLPGGRLIPSEERGEVVLWRLQIGQVEPGQTSLDVAPDPCTGAEFWAIRWQAHQVPVVRQGEPLGRLGPTMVQQEAVEAVSEGLGEGIEEELEPGRMER
jgi:hypothetical protein